MKFFRHILSAAVAVAAISCSEEISPEVDRHPENNLIPMTFTAVADSETKVAYDGQKTFWQENDEIMVIAENGVSAVFTVDKINDNIAIFKGELIESDTYYAVYPASAYLGNNLSENKIYAKVPNKQKAVAGSFDKDAFLSIASNGGKGNKLQFKNSCTVIGFQLAEPAGVKSVRFTANGQTNIAGNGVISTENIPIHSWDNTYSDRRSFDMITLEAPDGGFQSNTDYFLTIRAGRCPSGVKVYVEYNDGVKSRTSTNPLFGSTENYRSHMRHLGKFDTELTDMTPYERYQMGFDLVVGGKVINESSYGDATLISESTQLTTATSKVYFVDSNAELTYGISGNVSQLILIGNDLNQKSKLNATAQFKLECTDNYDSFILYNMDVVGGGNNFFTIYSTGTYEYVSLVNCNINMGANKKPLYYMSNANRTFDTFNMEGCNFVTSGDTQYIIQFGSSSTSIYQNIIFRNNIFYSTEDSGARAFYLIGNGGSTPVGTLILDQNTFANVYPLNSSGTATNYIALKSVDNYQVTNNLFYLPQYDILTSNNMSYVLKIIPANISAQNNLLYKTDNNNRLRLYDHNENAYPAKTVNVQNAVTVVDLGNGIIVPATSAGATR